MTVEPGRGRRARSRPRPSRSMLVIVGLVGLASMLVADPVSASSPAPAPTAPSGARASATPRVAPSAAAEGSSTTGCADGRSTPLVLFAADDGAHGREPWVTDGTAAGTRMVVDLLPGPRGSGPGALVTLDGAVFFVARDGEHGRALWRSDGTPDGTWMVADVVPSWIDEGLWSVGHRLIFGVEEKDGRRRLWTSDGTPAGTRGLGGVDLGSNYSYEGSILTVEDGVAYVVAHEAAPPSEGPSYYTPEPRARIVRTDGTEEGTWPVAEVRGSSPPGWAVRVSDRVVLAAQLLGVEPPGAQQSGTAREQQGAPVGLWSTNGSRGPADLIGTFAAADILWPWTGGDTLYLAADDGIHGFELWRTDGTAAGTRLVGDLRPGPLGSGPVVLDEIDGRLYLEANDGTGRSMWRSDGTAAGTSPLPGPVDGRARRADLVGVVEGRAIMMVEGGRDTHGLWVTDSTSPARHLEEPADPAWLPVDPDGGTFVGSGAPDHLLLLDRDPDGHRPLALWRTDGTPEGTRKLADIGRWGNEAYTGQDLAGRTWLVSASWAPRRRSQLWSTDGTRAGTYEVVSVPGHRTWETPLVDLGDGTFLFGAADGLRRTDGTAAGTGKISGLKAIHPVAVAPPTCTPDGERDADG